MGKKVGQYFNRSENRQENLATMKGDTDMERYDVTGEPGDGNRFASMPGKEPVEKQRNFFGLWSAITDATEHPDDDKFGVLCDVVFKNEYPDAKEAMRWLFEELEKVQDQKLRGGLMDAVVNLTEKCKYFYLTAGFALAQDYKTQSVEATEPIDYLRKRIREEGVFPLNARR